MRQDQLTAILGLWITRIQLRTMDNAGLHSTWSPRNVGPVYYNSKGASHHPWKIYSADTHRDLTLHRDRTIEAVHNAFKPSHTWIVRLSHTWIVNTSYILCTFSFLLFFSENLLIIYIKSKSINIRIIQTILKEYISVHIYAYLSLTIINLCTVILHILNKSCIFAQQILLIF